MKKHKIMSGNKKITYQTEQAFVDSETGEIISNTSYTQSILPKEPDFVKLYLDDISHLTKLPNWTNPILNELLKIMNYQNEIILNSSIKNRIAKRLEIQTDSIDKALQYYLKKNVLTRVEVGIFLANPYLFGKGEWKNIRNVRIEMGYDFEKKTKNLKASFEYIEEKERGGNDEN